MSKDPIVVEEGVTPPVAKLRLAVPRDLEYFEGHFPHAPIVPGVVLIEWAIDAAQRVLAVAGELARMEALKFQRVVVPGALLTLTLEWAAREGRLRFSYDSGDARFSSGRFVFRPAR